MYSITTFNDLFDDVFNEPIFRRSRKSYTNTMVILMQQF